MAQVNEDAYKKARLRDCDLTLELITHTDKILENLGLRSKCSDADSLKLELKDKYLVEVEFSNATNRGVGQQRMWKNGALKRNTITVVAYRKNLMDDTFTHINVYSPFHENIPITRPAHCIKDVAKFIGKIVEHIYN